MGGITAPAFVPVPNDHSKNVLKQEIDLPVKLRIKSGAEVAGMEFYDTVININDISAVLFKVRTP